MRKRVLFIKLYEDFGGAENQMSILIKKLFHENNTHVVEGVQWNLRNRIINILLLNIKAIFYLNKVDTFLFYNIYFFPAAFIYQIFGKKIIYSERILSNKNYQRIWVYKLFFKNYLIIVNSLVTKSFFKETLRFNKVFFVPNEIPIIHYERCKPKNSVKSIAIISRLHKEKGILEFLRALEHSSKTIINLYYTSEDPVYKADLVSTVKQKNLKVSFLGKEKLNKIFSENNLLIHPAFYEGTSNVILECILNSFPFYCRKIEQNEILGLSPDQMFDSTSELNERIASFNESEYQKRFQKGNKVLIKNYLKKNEIEEIINQIK